MRRLLSLILLVLFALPFVALSSASAASVRPVVKGGFDQTPTITFPAGTPSASLQVDYLHKGAGAKVKAGELLVANYLGQIWDGKVFDSSFARKQLSGFPIGEGQVISGWDKGLVGVPIGSEVLLVVPPADGYGTAGNTGAGIKANTTIVFVVDVVAAYSASAEADPHATIERSSVDGITIKGKLAAAPTVSIKKGTAEPKSIITTLLAKGHGAKIKAGLIVMQLVQVGWTGTIVSSTWLDKTPFAANIGVTEDPSIFDDTIGMTIGSRILVQLPANSEGGPYAVVADIVSEPADAAA